MFSKHRKVVTPLPPPPSSAAVSTNNASTSSRNVAFPSSRHQSPSRRRQLAPPAHLTSPNLSVPRQAPRLPLPRQIASTKVSSSNISPPSNRCRSPVRTVQDKNHPFSSNLARYPRGLQHTREGTDGRTKPYDECRLRSSDGEKYGDGRGRTVSPERRLKETIPVIKVHPSSCAGNGIRTRPLRPSPARSVLSTIASMTSISTKEYQFLHRLRAQPSQREITKVRHWSKRKRTNRPRVRPGTIATRHIILAPGKRVHTHKITWRVLPKMIRNHNRNRNNKAVERMKALVHRPVMFNPPINKSPPTNANWTALGGKRKRFHVTFAPDDKSAGIFSAGRDARNKNRNDNNEWGAMMKKNVELFYEKYEIQDKNTAALEDFTRYCTLGEGAFGRVMMLQNHGDKVFYAVKILRKEKVIEMQQEANCLNEKRVMQALTNPFIVNLAYHMKNNSYCFMVMEFITGGEMFDLLQDNGGPLGLEDVQFYMSNVILGFEYLQECNIVYRDLKPENVLLAGDGYAKIADFGLSKRVDGMTYTLCGTLEYLAPEVIATQNGGGYYKNFDWWTVGVLTYELAAGFPPFAGADEIEMFTLIQAIDYEIPDWFSDELADLVDGFLQPDSNRLGSRQGVDEIKDHPFFEGIDWIATYHKAVPPPFVPEFKDPTNPRNFKKRVIEEPIRVSAHDLYPEIFFDF